MTASARRGWLAVGVAALLSAAAPPAAGADELTVTAQAVAAHGEFLTQAPPPPTQGVLCLVDSGVDLNPDTQPILIGRESIFGGTLDDVTSYHHGTYVAMVAGAAANGWGMVGAWPWLKVLSVRVMSGDVEPLGSNEYRQGIQGCIRAKLDAGIDVRAIELAIGGPLAERAPDEIRDIADSVARARQDGMVVVAAAGNDAGAVNLPASLDGVMAVSGADRTGDLCAFSSRGPELDLAALGCDMDVAVAPYGWPGQGQSTSLASAYVAGVVVALRSYRPGLNVEQTEALVRASAAARSAGPTLDASAAFRAAGLGALVDAYRPLSPAPPGSSETAPSRACNARRRVCTRPHLRSIRRRGNGVVIRLARIPHGNRAIVSADGRPVLRTRSRTIRLTERRWKTVTIRFSARGRQPSAALRIESSEIR